MVEESSKSDWNQKEINPKGLSAKTYDSMQAYALFILTLCLILAEVTQNRVAWCMGRSNQVFIYDLVPNKLTHQFQGAKLKLVNGTTIEFISPYSDRILKSRRKKFISSKNKWIQSHNFDAPQF